jgi:hypothetical protein
MWIRLPPLAGQPLAVALPVRSGAGASTVDKWAEHQEDPQTRSEAIRRLVEVGLKAKK